MKAIDKEPGKGRGKPLGHRANQTLHTEIMRVLRQDKADGGDGMSANAIGKSLAQNDMTTRLYLSDLVEQKKVKIQKINPRMVLYKIPRASPTKK